MSSQHMQPSTGEEGFTLIELVVSMAILALIMGLVASSVQVMSAGWDRGGAAAVVNDMVGRASDVLRRDFHAARRIVVTGNEGKPRFLFQGGRQSMTYVLREPPYPTRPGLFLVRLGVEPDRRYGRRLIRSRTRYARKTAATLATKAGSLGEAAVVAYGNLDIDFAYRGHERADTWQSAWTDPRRMPTYVRVRIRAPGTTARPLPDIIARLGISAEQGCAGTGQPCTIRTKGILPNKAGAAQKPARGERESRLPDATE